MSTDTDIHNPDAVNHDPEDVKRANGRLVMNGAIFGMALFVVLMGLLTVFGVPSDNPLLPGGHQQQAAAPAQTGSQVARP